MKFCELCRTEISNRRKYCTDCSKDVRRIKQRQYIKKWFEKNKEIIKIKYKEYHAEYRKNHREKNKEYSKGSEVRKYQREYMRKLRQSEEFKKKRNERHKENYVENSSYKLRMVLSGRIRRAIKEQYGKKSAKTIELVGCSLEFLKERLQQTAIQNGYLDFDIENYSGKKYHIDHIKPCASFDLSKEEEQRKCFHWSNLQILSANDNYKKRDKICWGIIIRKRLRT